MKKLIVYTDIGADPDDTAALAMLMHLHRRGAVELLSVVCATARRDADRCLAAIAAYYGYDRPLGRMDGPAIPCDAVDRYAGKVAARFPAAAQWEGYDMLTARLLREHPGTDIVSLGPLTVFAALFDKDFGGYGGAALLREYAGTLYVMAGRFDSPEPEWNVAQDVAAARRFVREAANDIVFLPFETGVGIFTGRPFKTDKDNPCRACFNEFFGGEPDPFVRSSWDPLTAYVAAFGTDGFDVSPPGTVTVSETGVTAFAPGADGKHRYVSRCKDGGLAEARIDALLLP